MEFILQIYADEKQLGSLSDADAQRMFGAYMAFSTALREAGAYVAGDRLAPSSTATTVRVSGEGKTTVLDGPYADTKEQLGGYYVIEATNLDAAIAWAARCPGASHGTIEVRPIAEIPAPV